MSDAFQNFTSPLGQPLGPYTKLLEAIGFRPGYAHTETSIFTEIMDVLEVRSLAVYKFSRVVTLLGKWDKKVGKIVHGEVPDFNISDIDKKEYLRKNGIHYMIQRARRDMDEMIESLEKLRIAVENANEEFVRENNINNNSDNDNDSDNDNSSDNDSDRSNEDVGDIGEFDELDRDSDSMPDFDLGRNVRHHEI